MKYILLLTSLLLSVSYANNKYLDNHSCKECHEKIYDEYKSSSHSRGYFDDELHRKIANSVSDKKYDCAVCHMPMAKNLKDIMIGKARPNKSNQTHADNVSCFFCHTVAYVKKAHMYNINIAAKQAKNYKPSLYGRLDNPEDSDKHSSVNNPIYGQKACMGCHSHKLNENNVTIFRAMGEKDNSIECIKCHMPELDGGVDKLDKKTRGHHASHKFLGIRDSAFRATGLDINISTKSDTISVKLTNKMSHPLIIQPARVKYLVVKVIRGDKMIWRSYKKSPKENSSVYFEYRFKDKNGKKIIIPAKAFSGESTNLEAHSSMTATYSGIELKKGDVVVATMYARLAKLDCQAVVKLDSKEFTEKFVLKEQRYTIK